MATQFSKDQEHYPARGGHNHYQRILRCLYIDGAIMGNVGGALSAASKANFYTASPIEIPVRCRIDRIGIMPTALITGNLRLGMHYSDGGLLPDSKVLQSAQIAVGAFTASDWNWVTPETTPTIDPGYYYLGWICDTTYVAATSGMIVGYNIMGTGVSNRWNDGLSGLYEENVGSLTVPDPMTEVLLHQTRILWMGVGVTVL